MRLLYILRRRLLGVTAGDWLTFSDGTSNYSLVLPL